MRRRRGLDSNKKISLEHDRFSPEYLQRLAYGFNVLTQWFLSLKPMPVVSWNRVSVNTLLIRFIQDMFDTNVALYVVTHALLAFEKSYPQFSKKLGPAWASIKSWKMRSAVSLRVPMPPQVLHALVLFSLMLGFRFDPLHADVWIPFGLQLWLGYEGLFRPGELARICRRHLSLPSNAVCSFTNCILVLIEEPKNRATFGRMQTSIIRHPALIRWLEWLCVDLPPARDSPHFLCRGCAWS